MIKTIYEFVISFFDKHVRAVLIIFGGAIIYIFILPYLDCVLTLIEADKSETGEVVEFVTNSRGLGEVIYKFYYNGEMFTNKDKSSKLYYKKESVNVAFSKVNPRRSYITGNYYIVFLYKTFVTCLIIAAYLYIIKKEMKYRKKRHN